MSGQPNGPLIFVVDDEKLIASTLALILTGKGFHARPFFDPLDALRAAESANPDLLLSDVVMPNMNGIELAVQLQRVCPACKILLSSGQVATTELLAAARMIGHDFEILAKPVHPDTLLQKMEEVLGWGPGSSPL